MAETITKVRFDVNQYPIGASAGIIGIDQPNLRPLSYHGEVDSERTDYGKQFKDLLGGITAQDLEVLFDVYLKREWDRELKRPEQTTEEQNKLLDYLFDNFGWEVCNNAVDYNEHGNLKPKEGYSRAAIHTSPKSIFFDEESELWKVEGRADPVHDYVPSTGFPLLTNDGRYNPETFVPFATTSEKEKAVESYIQKGFSPEFANKAVAKFWSAQEGAGARSVDLRCGSGWYYARFLLDADRDPDVRDDWVGRLFASRLPSGARRDSEIEVVSPAEYRRVVNAWEASKAETDDLKQELEGLKEAGRKLFE